MLLWSFLFLLVLARAVIPVFWRLWIVVARLHPRRWPEAGGWGDLRTEAVPRKFSDEEAAVQPDCCRAGAQDPGHPISPALLPLAQPPRCRADRAAVCARLAPRSVQLFPLGDPPGVGEMSPEPLGWEERERASIQLRALHLGPPSHTV